ncbi:hypothetical protein MTBGP_02630 [Moorella thermoacetica]|uniref:hypothetical protein n=1 Tax=Neomoorella thermoacetica TaxID=1525 RepID=UPI0030D415CF
MHLKKEKSGFPAPPFKASGSALLPCLLVALLFIFLLPCAGRAATATTTATLGGTIVTGANTESSINNGNETIIITLNGNTWVSDVASNPDRRNLLFDSMVAASEPEQWAKVITALKSASDPSSVISYTYANTVTITLPQVSGYNITADQKVTVNIPPSLLEHSGSPVSAPPSFTVRADPQATITGSITKATEADIVAGGKTIVITLTNEKWDSDIVTTTSKRDQLFDCLTTQDQPAEWDKVITALKYAPDPGKVISLSSDNSTVTLTLPPVPDYHISDRQTITLNIDPSLLQSNKALTTPAPSFVIDPATTTAVYDLKLNGQSKSQIQESDIKNNNNQIQITITLRDNSWATDMAKTEAKRDLLFDSMVAASEPEQWAKVINQLKSKGSNAITLSPTNDTVTITLPQVSDYNITADQRITLTVPSTLLADNYPVDNPFTFTIKADQAAAVSGTITPSVTEADIVNGGRTIVITLTNTTWEPDIATSLTKRELLIDGFSATDDTNQWQKVIDAMKAAAVFTRTSDQVLTITLPPVPGFNLTGEINVSLTVPGSVVTAATDLPVSEAFTITPVTTQTATLSGTITQSTTESNIVSGGRTIIITLANDTWAADVASDPNKRNALIGGLSAAADGGKWNTNVIDEIKNKANTDPSVVVRTSDQVLTITLPPVNGFDIADDITVSLTIPASVLTTANEPITVSPAFTIYAIKATLSGTFVTAPPDVAAIVAGGKTIIITLTNATWASDVATNQAKRQALIDGFIANNNANDSEWADVKAALKKDPRSVTRTSNTVVTIKLPPVPGYSITSGQTITLTIPATLINGAANDVTATPSLQVGSAATATISGTLLSSATAADIVAGGKTIVITLTNATWASDVATNLTKRRALIDGFIANNNRNDKEWAKVKTALKADPASVTRDSDSVVTIMLPPVPDYDIIAPQTVSLTIPKAALVGSSADVIATPSFTITLPVFTSRGTLEESLTNGNLDKYMETLPLNQIYIVVPKKYINTIAINHTALGDSSVTIVDVLAEPEVASVKVTAGTTERTATTYSLSGGKRKFSLGFAGLSTPGDITVSVLDGSGNKLQGDVTRKISNGKKSYTEAPQTALEGSYNLYKLMTDNTLLKNILKYYSLADLTVGTP